MLDSFERDLEGRYTFENTKLWDSLKNLLPGSNHFLDPYKLKPLLEYLITISWFGYLLETNKTIEDVFTLLKSECFVFRGMLKRKFTLSDDERKKKGLNNGYILSSMFTYCQHEESTDVVSVLLRIGDEILHVHCEECVLSKKPSRH